MRVLRDVDLHRPATRRRRRVELPNPSVYIPSVAHQCRAPTTHLTNTCLQSDQRNHHYRDCLYNIRHNTEHKYINLGCLRGRHAANISRTPCAAASSLPTLDTTYPKKNFSIFFHRTCGRAMTGPHNRTCGARAVLCGITAIFRCSSSSHNGRR